MRRLTLISLLCLAILSSCSPVKQLNIEKISLSEVRMESSTKASLTFEMDVYNNSQSAIFLTGATGTLRRDMDLFATVELADTVMAQPMETKKLRATVNVALCDPMSLLSMGLNIRNWDINSFTISGKMTLEKEKGGKRSHKIKDMPLKKLLNMLN